MQGQGTRGYWFIMKRSNTQVSTICLESYMKHFPCLTLKYLCIENCCHDLFFCRLHKSCTEKVKKAERALLSSSITADNKKIKVGMTDPMKPFCSHYIQIGFLYYKCLSCTPFDSSRTSSIKSEHVLAQNGTSHPSTKRRWLHLWNFE